MTLDGLVGGEQTDRGSVHTLLRSPDVLEMMSYCAINRISIHLLRNKIILLVILGEKKFFFFLI